MKHRLLPGRLLMAVSLLPPLYALYRVLSAYPALPAALSSGLGKPILLFVPVFALLTWVLLLLAFFRAPRLLLPLPFGEAGLQDARCLIADALALLALLSGAGYLAAVRFLLADRTIPAWLYALLVGCLFAVAGYMAFALIRIAKRHGVREKEVSEAEAEAAWEAFIKNKS